MRRALLRQSELAAVDLLCAQKFASIYDFATLDVRKLALPVSVTFETFLNYARETDMDPADLKHLRTPEGMAVRYGNRYLVLYDDSMPARRLNWTLAHELGHILLGHLGEECPAAEREANVFAASLLCPTVALHYLEHRDGRALTEDDLTAVFPISREAAVNRLKDLRRTAKRQPNGNDIALLLALFGLIGKAQPLS